MSTFQSLIAVIALVYVLSVIVQAVQQFIKNRLDMKASTLKDAITKFMGTHLTVDQVTQALGVRGLDLTALEHLNAQEFRHLLDGITFAAPQLTGIVASATATAEQVKENIAASFEAALAAFQKVYTKRNKLIAVVLSMVAVGLLNANVIIIYENIVADPAAQQAIVSKAQALGATTSTPCNAAPSADVVQDYKNCRGYIQKVIQGEPTLVRTKQYPDDFRAGALREIVGLLLMGGLVSLGAPFWNDVLKGAMGVNNALNGNKKA
jgi:hypothetical protein